MHSTAWVVFGIIVIVLLVLDLKVFHKEAHEIRMKEALGWSVFWIALALLFNAGIFFEMGHTKGMEFLAGYLIEKSLSVDNLFVFLAVFTYFAVPSKFQHKILFWGIIGALLMRAVFIFAGVALLNRFHWIMYVFGVFLVYTSYKLAFKGDTEVHPDKNIVVIWAKKLFPFTSRVDDGAFFTIENGRRVATPLFLVLIVVETTDLVFAVDSIPAVLAVSRDPFIVFTSNVFAILGLRALYFALADALRLFHYLNIGLAFILTFVGAKMILSDLVHVPIAVTLSVVGGLLILSVLASLLHPKK